MGTITERRRGRLLDALLLALLAGALLGGAAGAATPYDRVMRCDGQCASHDGGAAFAADHHYYVVREGEAVAVYGKDGSRADLGGVLRDPDSLGVVVLDGRVLVLANGTDGLYFREARAGTTDFGPWVRFAEK